MSARSPLRHPTGWRGGHFYRSGDAWSGCGNVFLSVSGDTPTTASYEGEFTAEHTGGTLCCNCLYYSKGRRDAIKEFDKKGKVQRP